MLKSGELRVTQRARYSHAHETREMFAATLATSGATAVAGSPLGATRARRSPAVTSPARLASPKRATTVRRRLDLRAVATENADRKPREVKTRAQVTTKEVTVSEVSGSVAAPMPEDDSVKVRTNASSWRLPSRRRGKHRTIPSTSRLATVAMKRVSFSTSSVRTPLAASVALTKINPFPFPDDTTRRRAFLLLFRSHARDDENHP